MKAEKIFYQFYKAIEKCTAIGTDKYSYKKSNCKKVKIFSYEDRRNLIKVTSLLCDFLEEIYSEIVFIKDIKTKHIQNFFIEKAKYCTKSTLKNYYYCIRKLEKMIKQELLLSIDYTSNIKIPNGTIAVLRDIKMNEGDLQILLDECNKSSSKARSGIMLSMLFGLRVSECCKIKGKDIKLADKFIHIHDSKGKRCRNIKIETEEQRKFCEYIKATVSGEDRICPLREDSVNQEIRRMLLKHKINIYQESKTGIHAIRKSYATKKYKDNLQQGMDETDAWDNTCDRLGHGAGRKVLKNVYVKNN